MMLLTATVASALPMYAQRSARTCANCHVSPTLEDPGGWENPALVDRKCTLSCTSCHVDPAGGGPRNASGKYFAGSTLAMLPTRERSYSDRGRELLPSGVLWKWRQRRSKPPVGEGRSVPSDAEEAQGGVGKGQNGNILAIGNSETHHRRGYWNGRYGRLAADPTVQVGGDLRLAYYTGTRRFFPMQLDLHAVVHPVEHLSLVATGALQSPAAVGKLSPVFARRAFVMLHELPGNSWAKVGAFQPMFGTLLDDHTSPVRTLFEGGGAESRNTVIGGEIGTAPNYPFASVSVFANDARWVGAAPDDGWGATAKGGWRGLQFSLMGHAMVRSRRRDGLYAAGISWGFTPRSTWKALPTTWIGEVSVGRTRKGSHRIAGMSELSALVRNGIILKLKSDVWSATGESWQHRHGPAVAFTPVPGLTFEGNLRVLFAPGEPVRADWIGQVHLSF